MAISAPMATINMRSRTTDYTAMARVAQKWLQLKKILILSISILLGPFRDSRAPSWLFGPQTDVPAEPPSHIPWLLV
jgi:hypothetical protein